MIEQAKLKSTKPQSISTIKTKEESKVNRATDLTPVHHVYLDLESPAEEVKLRIPPKV